MISLRHVTMPGLLPCAAKSVKNTALRPRMRINIINIFKKTLRMFFPGFPKKTWAERYFFPESEIRNPEIYRQFSPQEKSMVFKSLNLNDVDPGYKLSGTLSQVMVYGNRRMDWIVELVKGWKSSIWGGRVLWLRSITGTPNERMSLS